MKTKYIPLSPAVERRVEEICRCMKSRFSAYVCSLAAADLPAEREKALLEILHPCNRDQYLKGFGRFLLDEKIEFASND